MQEVIGRMSAAQIEVLNLQEEREDAVRETRRVQKLLEAEQVRAFEERFRSITEIR
jgi:dTDP-4-amino-4,6-dideoxygalactose transaminase